MNNIRLTLHLSIYRLTNFNYPFNVSHINNRRIHTHAEEPGKEFLLSLTHLSTDNVIGRGSVDMISEPITDNLEARLDPMLITAPNAFSW